MDLECGDTVRVKAEISWHGDVVENTILLETVFKNESGVNVLTPDEARMLGNALIRTADTIEREAPVDA